MYKLEFFYMLVKKRFIENLSANVYTTKTLENFISLLTQKDC